MNDIVDKKIAGLYESGLSVAQISDRLSISSSKARYSLEKQSIPRRDHSTASRMLHITKFGKEQCVVKNKLTIEENDLRITGIMLYWGEGTKSGNSVVFSNSDPQMIMLFLKFLRAICQISETRLRILLHMYNDQNENSLKKFWSKATNIPITQFSKTFYHHHTSGTYKKVSQYGTVSLRYSDKSLLETINKWISQYHMPI